MMALQLTPPTKKTFYLSLVLALLSVIYYFAGVFGAPPSVFHFAFWFAILAWLAMAFGAGAKGV
jgi:hypothetical protein